MSRFIYDIVGEDARVIGALQWPKYAQAKNARLHVNAVESAAGEIAVQYEQHHYSIAFEYLTRDWNNDVAFFLKDGGRVIAMAQSIKSSKNFRRRELRLLTPLSASIARRRTWPFARYELMVGDQVQGCIREPRRLTMKRQMYIELPASLTPPVQLFLFFLVCNDAYR